ncbi:hypothetical protein [Shimia marina]|uniref:hypothetical protein n=1 Tax=Shimia marina TaxID=321267 RepID=UPI0011874C2B|nr:hypothetical protein [Shimia marina]
MALVLIFAGSMAGLLIGAFQMMFQDASVWALLTTYLSFSLAFPAVALTLAMALGTLRPSHDETDLFNGHQA